MNNEDLDELLGYLNIPDILAIDKKLLTLALSHKSVRTESKQNEDNERLEYLGDAILKLSVSEWLYKNYPNSSEGEMSKIRAYVVSDKTLSHIAKKINLGKFIILSKREALSGGATKESILANVLESVMGVVFLSTDYITASKMVINLTQKELKKAIDGKAEEENAKDALQKITQAVFKCLPEYKTSHLEGPPHNATFQCFLTINEKEFYATGASKKEAEQHAAKLALKDLKNEQEK